MQFESTNYCTCGHVVFTNLGFNLGSTLAGSISTVFELHAIKANPLEELASIVANIVIWIFHANMEFIHDILLFLCVYGLKPIDFSLFEIILEETRMKMTIVRMDLGDNHLNN